MALGIDVSYSDADLPKPKESARLKSGSVYHMRCVSVQDGVSEKKHTLMQTLTYAPLNEAGMTCLPTFRDTLFPPFLNPNAPEPKVPNTFGLCHAYLHAVMSDIPKFPRWDKEMKTHVTADGESITKDEADELRKEINRRIQQEMKSRWDDSSAYIGEEHFALIDDDKNNPKYQRVVKRFRSEHEVKDAGLEVTYELGEEDSVPF